MRHSMRQMAKLAYAMAIAACRRDRADVAACSLSDVFLVFQTLNGTLNADAIQIGHVALALDYCKMAIYITSDTMIKSNFL